MRSKDNTVIQVDHDFAIEVEEHNWTVLHRGNIKRKTGIIEKEWKEIGYCADFPAALKFILKHKTFLNESVVSVRDYLSWYESNTHTMLDRVLRKDEELKVALDRNGVLISKNN